MAQHKKRYKVRYLPVFWEDLNSATTYISKTLGNQQAALKLLNDVEREVLFHAEEPTMASVYKTTKTRPLPYYWFPVGNYMAFYVVLEDCIEMRRFLYGSRNVEKLIS